MRDDAEVRATKAQEVKGRQLMKFSILERLAKSVTARAARIWAFGFVAAIAATTLPVATPAAAHGERSQQAFLRMRTLNWYDVKWSKTELNVNEEMELTGKVHIFSGWPQAVAKPEVAFLNVGEPGPVLIRKSSWVGGTPVPRSFSLEVGKDYGTRSCSKPAAAAVSMFTFRSTWRAAVRSSVPASGSTSRAIWPTSPIR